MTVKHLSDVPSEDSRVILDTLKAAVTDALEKKRRLGQYAVVWKNGRPTRIGGDEAMNGGEVING